MPEVDALCRPKEQLHPKRGNPFKYFITGINAFMIILVNNGDQLEQGCVIPIVRYHPKRANNLQNFIHGSC